MVEFKPSKRSGPTGWITSEERLADCPAAVAELYRYWNERRAARLMPARADIRPEDIKPHLPDIILVDVEGVEENGTGIYRYRLVGTGAVALRGDDPTGKSIGEAYFGASRDLVIDGYELVRRERSFLCKWFEYTSPLGVWRKRCLIFLPLSEDEETVTQILVYGEADEPGGAG